MMVFLWLPLKPNQKDIPLFSCILLCVSSPASCCETRLMRSGTKHSDTPNLESLAPSLEAQQWASALEAIPGRGET